MPLFNHKCKECGLIEEFLVKGPETPKKQCPKCDATNWERMFTSKANIAFKGKGFYVTDNRNS